MSIDFKIGFREKPSDLALTMSTAGFVLYKSTPTDGMLPCRMDWYRFFDEHRSGRGVGLVYHDGIYEDHNSIWQGIIDDPKEIVATADVMTNMGRNGFDLKKQKQTAIFLRDRYHAILYDPQSR